MGDQSHNIMKLGYPLCVSAPSCLLRRVAESCMRMEAETPILLAFGPFWVGCTGVSAVEEIVVAILFRSRYKSLEMSVSVSALNSQNDKMQLLY